MIGVQACPYAIFRAEDTNGKPIEKIENKIPKPNLIEIAERLNIKVRYGKSDHGEFGTYNPEKDEITLCTEEESTFFHELAHAVQKRVDGFLKNGQDVDQEFIAQLSASVISSIYGKNIDANTQQYLASYAGSYDKIGERIYRVISKVQKILDYIFEVKKEIETEQQTE